MIRLIANPIEELENIYYQYEKCFGEGKYELYKMISNLEFGYGFSREDGKYLKKTIKNLYKEAKKKNIKIKLTKLSESQLEESINDIIDNLREYPSQPTEEQKEEEKDYLINNLKEIEEATKDAAFLTYNKKLHNRAKKLISRLENGDYYETNKEEAYEIIFKNEDIIEEYENSQNQNEFIEQPTAEEPLIMNNQNISLMLLLERLIENFRRSIPAENTAYNIIYPIYKKLEAGKELNSKDINSLKRILNLYKNVERFGIPNIDYNEEVIESLLLNNNAAPIIEHNEDEEQTPEQQQEEQEDNEEMEDVMNDIDSNNTRAEKLYLKSIAAFGTGAILGIGAAAFTPLPVKAVKWGVPAFFVASGAVQIIDNVKQAKIERIQTAEDYENEHPERPKTNTIWAKFKRFLTSKYTRLFVTGFALGFGGATLLKNKGFFGKSNGIKGNGTSNNPIKGTEKGNTGLKDPVIKKETLTEGAKDNFKALTKEDIMKDPSVLKDLKVDLSGIKGYTSSDATKSTSIINELAKNAKIVKSGNGKYIRNGRIITKSLDGDYLEWADLSNKKVIAAINKALKLTRK